MGELGSGDVHGRPALISAAKRSVVEERFQLLTDAGLKIAGFQGDPLAIVNFAAYEFGELKQAWDLSPQLLDIRRAGVFLERAIAEKQHLLGHHKIRAFFKTTGLPIIKKLYTIGNCQGSKSYEIRIYLV